jgi:hypothetical protein
MTRKRAKEISLEVWRYLAGRPEICRKEDMPAALYRKISRSLYYCWLCNLYGPGNGPDNGCPGCPGCPLSAGGSWCGCPEHPYYRWLHSLGTAGRKEAAEEIARLIEAWEVQEAAGRKALYLVTAAQCGWDEYDGIVVVARSEKQAVEKCLEGYGENGGHYTHFGTVQGPFTAVLLDPAKYKTGDRHIASFNAG